MVALTGAPVTSTLMGLGALPASAPEWLGMLGMHGTYEADHAMNRADLILALGARFDDRVTGRLDAFAAPVFPYQGFAGLGRRKQHLPA